MKITAALITAALAVSVHCLPMTSSGTSLFARRSDVQLEDSAILQAPKRSTDTNQATRQLNDDGESQALVLARGTDDILFKRAPTFELGESSGKVQEQLTKILSGNEEVAPVLHEEVVALPLRLDMTPLRLARYRIRLEHQMDLDHTTYNAVHQASLESPKEPHLPLALKERKKRFHESHGRWMNAHGLTWNNGILERATSGPTHRPHPDHKATLTRQQLDENRGVEFTVLESLQQASQKVKDPTSQASRSLSGAMDQSMDRFDENERQLLEHARLKKTP